MEFHVNFTFLPKMSLLWVLRRVGVHGLGFLLGFRVYAPGGCHKFRALPIKNVPLLKRQERWTPHLRVSKHGSIGWRLLRGLLHVVPATFLSLAGNQGIQSLFNPYILHSFIPYCSPARQYFPPSQYHTRSG